MVALAMVAPARVCAGEFSSRLTKGRRFGACSDDRRRQESPLCVDPGFGPIFATLLIQVMGDVMHRQQRTGIRAGRGAAGFTLVEIAIVLVIVGLLLGGIFKGQELLTTARMHNLADQHASIQAAYFSFVDRYRYVPGDMPNAAAVAAIGDEVRTGAQYGGDGDGQIDDGNFQEVSAVWHHLAAAGFIQGGFQGGATGESSYVAGDVAPTNVFNGRMLLGQTDEYLHASGTAPPRLALVFGDQIPAEVLHNLDSRLDDGRPATGSLRAATSAPAGANHYGGVEQSNDSSCVQGTGAAATWNLSAANCNAVYLY